MKKLFFVLCCVWLSFQLTAATGNPAFVLENEAIELTADYVSVDLVNAELIEADETLACWIIHINTSCGGSYDTQYCDEGLHGDDPIDWVMEIESQDCD